MQEAAAPPASPFPLWAFVASGLVIAFAVLFFFQTRDPMILIFGLMAAGMVWVVALLVRLLSGGMGGGVVLRCPSCRGLNPESARFCNGCGKGL
jgi:hypothetical protein